jgi:predicted transposase/invertase (TIGR01784 family)
MSFVDLPGEEFELAILDPHVRPETEDGKPGILDVKIRTKSGKIINIEIQVNPVRDIGERISFYKSKLITEQIAAGENYTIIQRVICVAILDWRLFSGAADYLNYFRFCNPATGLIFEGVPEEIITVELPKLPRTGDGTEVWDWLAFLRSRQKEEFEMAAEKNPLIREAVDTLYRLSADPELRAQYEARQKAWMDWKAEMDGSFADGMEKGRADGMEKGRAEGMEKGRAEGMAEGIQQGRIDTVRRLKEMGFSLEDIARGTGLDIETARKIVLQG